MHTELLLIRHATTGWHGQNRNLGRNDIPLNEEGRAQAAGLADALAGKNITRVLSSPLARARQTAQVIAERHRLVVQLDPRLTDLSTGEWEGLDHAELAARADFQRFLEDPLGVRIPGGETLEAVRDRALAALEDGRRGLPSGDALALVTHSDIVRLLLAHLLDVSLGRYLRFQIDLASISSVLLPEGRQPRVVRVNATSHSTA